MDEKKVLTITDPEPTTSSVHMALDKHIKAYGKSPDSILMSVDQAKWLDKNAATSIHKMGTPPVKIFGIPVEITQQQPHADYVAGNTMFQIPPAYMENLQAVWGGSPSEEKPYVKDEDSFGSLTEFKEKYVKKPLYPTGTFDVETFSNWTPEAKAGLKAYAVKDAEETVQFEAYATSVAPSLTWEGPEAKVQWTDEINKFPDEKPDVNWKAPSETVHELGQYWVSMGTYDDNGITVESEPTPVNGFVVSPELTIQGKENTFLAPQSTSGAVLSAYQGNHGVEVHLTDANGSGALVKVQQVEIQSDNGSHKVSLNLPLTFIELAGGTAPSAAAQVESDEIDDLMEQIEDLKIEITELNAVNTALSEKNPSNTVKALQGIMATYKAENKSLKAEGHKTASVIMELKESLASLTDKLTAVNDLTQYWKAQAQYWKAQAQKQEKVSVSVPPLNSKSVVLKAGGQMLLVSGSSTDTAVTLPSSGVSVTSIPGKKA